MYVLCVHNRPQPGEMRTIRLEKSLDKNLGIHFESAGSGGIFVSSVSQHSLASRAGVEVGDQLIEVRTYLHSHSLFFSFSPSLFFVYLCIGLHGIHTVYTSTHYE